MSIMNCLHKHRLTRNHILSPVHVYQSCTHFSAYTASVRTHARQVGAAGRGRHWAGTLLAVLQHPYRHCPRVAAQLRLSTRPQPRSRCPPRRTLCGVPRHDHSGSAGDLKCKGTVRLNTHVAQRLKVSTCSPFPVRCTSECTSPASDSLSPSPEGRVL